MKKFFQNKNLAISVGAAILFFAVLGIENLPNEHIAKSLTPVPITILKTAEDIFESKQLEEGLILYRQGKYEEAINFYTEFLKENPNDAVAYNQRGNVYKLLKQYDAALTDYNRALQINPKYAKVYNNRGNAYTDLKLYDTAISDFNHAIELNFNQAYYNRGFVYCQLQQYQKAIEDFNTAIEFQPNFAAAYHNRGLCYKILGENEKANADFTTAKQLGYK